MVKILIPSRSQFSEAYPVKMRLVAFLLVTNAALANPVVSVGAEKSWERCLISVGQESSTVSCAVGYRAAENVDKWFFVSVPVILPKSMKNDEVKAKMAIRAQLEIGGEVYSSYEISFHQAPMLEEETTLALCQFSVIGVPGKSFALVVTYEQPTIGGYLYYLPRFEDGKNPRDFEEFSVSAFPAHRGRLKLESRHQQKNVAFATRITVHPLNDELIKIGIISGD